MTNIRATVTFEVTDDLSSALRKATEDAFAEVTGELTARFDDAVSGNYWPWPRESKRFGAAVTCPMLHANGGTPASTQDHLARSSTAEI